MATIMETKIMATIIEKEKNNNDKNNFKIQNFKA